MSETFSIWLIIGLLAIGTFAIRFSFLGIFGKYPLPPWVKRLLSYANVAVIPGLIAPLVIWPPALEHQFDPPRFIAACVTCAVGFYMQSLLWAAMVGFLTLYIGIWVF